MRGNFVAVLIRTIIRDCCQSGGKGTETMGNRGNTGGRFTVRGFSYWVKCFATSLSDRARRFGLGMGDLYTLLASRGMPRGLRVLAWPMVYLRYIYTARLGLIVR